jgi:hypothetical protein
MNTGWKILGEASRRWAPLKRCMPLTQMGLPLDYARPEPSHRPALLPSGRAVVSFAAARPPNLTEEDVFHFRATRRDRQCR